MSKQQNSFLYDDREEIVTAVIDRSLMQSDHIELIAKQLKLEPFFEFYQSENEGKNLPYHNFYHAKCVFLNCYEACFYEEIDKEAARGLCAAALFHDFNHSGGRLIDSENIKLAICGLMLAQTHAQKRSLGLSLRSLLIAKDAIKVTEFPFVHEPKTITQKIIRDADLMQPFEDDSVRLRNQYVGLKAEIEVSTNTTLNLVDFAVGCKDFQDAHHWFTRWAEEKAKEKNWEKRKENLELLLIEGENNV